MPAAVAYSASVRPPETTFISFDPDSAMRRKAFWMPMTVPNRPTKTAMAPTVPMIHRRDLSPSMTRTRSRSTAEARLSFLVRPSRS